MTSQSTRSGRPEGANEAKANCGVLRIVGSIAGAANSFADVVSVLCLAVAAILVFMQVLLRYVFRIGFVWTEELARYLIVYCSLIGSSIVVRNDAHPRVEVFVELLPHALRRYFSVLLDLLVLGFLGVLIWQGIESTMFGMRTKTPGLAMPWAYAYAAIPVSGVLMAIQVVFRMVSRIRGDL